MPLLNIFFGAGGIIIGLLVGLFALRSRQFNEKEIEAKTAGIFRTAEKESAAVIEKARAHAEEMKQQFAVEAEEFNRQMAHMEKMYETKQASFQKRESRVQELRRALQAEELSVSEIRTASSGIDKKMADQLLRITGLSKERVREELIAHFENEFKADAELRIQQAMQWASENALRDARNTLSGALYRFSDITSVEHEEKNIIVPRDEIKGRIVGRGGLIIAFFENLFGVDVIFNDEPDTIIVSCFNLVQREIAVCALNRLMREKNITEEAIQKIKPLAEQDVDKILRRYGENALKLVGLTNMAPDFVKLVGRLQFRTSYGQNIMRHCLEVGFFARLMASEIGADENIAFLGGFFHDVGKAIDQEVGGSHDVLSKEILEKYGFSWEITHAAWTHHNAAPQETIEARIVQAADALSASRPGARAESVERYLAKIKDLQETALSFAGVRKAFAINAGRELRVVVESDKMDDAGAENLAQEIAAKVQEKGGYPGKIKIVTIRTTKTTDYAR